MPEKGSKRLLKTGVIGSVITAACCFTPALTATLGLIGLGAVTGYLDYILLPGLGIFVGITVYALGRRRGGACAAACSPDQALTKRPD